MDHFPNPEITGYTESFDKEEKYQESIIERLTSLLASKVSLTEIVGLLGADKFLRERKSRDGSIETFFDVRGFIDDAIKEHRLVTLPTKYEKVDSVFLPPNDGEVKTGSGKGFEPVEIINRDQFLVQVLSELEQNYLIYEGQNSPRMMRALSYLAFVIPGLQKLVLVNNEAENATFVVNGINPEEEWERYASLTKEELKDLPNVTPIIYTGDSLSWQTKIKEVLSAEYTVPSPQEAMPASKEGRATEKAPEGWLTKSVLFNQVGAYDELVNPIVKEYRESHPEWFKIYLTKINHSREHFSPELVSIIKSRILERGESAPVGWATCGTLKKELQVDYETIQRVAEEYKESHPEWFKIYLNKINHLLEYYSPELITTIKDRVLSRGEKAPEDWTTTAPLATELGVNKRRVGALAEEYRESHPQWFKVYLGKINRPHEYFSPELISIIKERILGKGEKAPEGWINTPTLLRKFGIGPKAVKRLTKDYKVSHPEWFKVYLNPQNKNNEYFSPELVAIIQQSKE